jgi:hypothetical protein
MRLTIVFDHDQHWRDDHYPKSHSIATGLGLYEPCPQRFSYDPTLLWC